MSSKPVNFTGPRSLHFVVFFFPLSLSLLLRIAGIVRKSKVSNRNCEHSEILVTSVFSLRQRLTSARANLSLLPSSRNGTRENLQTEHLREITLGQFSIQLHSQIDFNSFLFFLDHFLIGESISRARDEKKGQV